MKEKQKRKMHPLLKGFLGCILVIVILVIGGGYFVTNYIYDKMQSEVEGEEEELTDERKEAAEEVAKQPFKVEGIKNILLIGNDSRKNSDDGRSDAMILVTVNGNTNKIYMTSIMRDIYVDIPGHQSNRINAAYAYGGPELLMETIKENFGITVNRYAQVNFQAFVDVVDAVGGVTLDVTNAEVKYINDFLVEYNQLEGKPVGTDYLDTSLSGNIHLNGAQALSFCRNRSIGNDFARTERQRKVLNAIFEEAPSALLSNTEELADGLLKHVTTNLKKSEIFGLMMQAPTLLGYEVVQSRIPLDDTYKSASIRGMSVLQIDFEKNKEYIETEINAK